MTTDHKYQVAVIVYTYNSDPVKTIESLKSAILQKGVKHQIIIADDGSADNHRTEIEELFGKLDFHDYRLSFLESNRGITENLKQASCFVEAEYIKILSPGDFLAEDDVLAKLYSFAKAGGYRVCFGDAVYFRREGSVLQPMKNHNNAPAVLRPYDTGNIRAQRRSCLMTNDFILGAAVFTETNTYREYINRISGHVKYFEDNALRIMIYDGIAVRHFPEVIMWYEYGNGISTGESEFWTEWLHKDYLVANRLMVATDIGNNLFQIMIRFVYSMNKITCCKRFMVLPGALMQMIRKKLFPKRVPYRKPETFLDSIIMTGGNSINEKI